MWFFVISEKKVTRRMTLSYEYREKLEEEARR
jgi:hypothetical protein